MQWPTAQLVCEQAALELGLVQSPGELGEDIYTSTDANLIQLTRLLKKCGRDLVSEAEWTHLRKEFCILTPDAAASVAAQQSAWGAFMLPNDWKEMIQQSGWNRTTRLPMRGPLSEQEWQFLSARNTGVVLNVLFRPMQGLMFLYPSTNIPANQEIAMAYKSAWWVQNTAWLANPSLLWTPNTIYNAGAVIGWGPPAGTYTRPFISSFYRCVRPGTSGAVGPDPTLAASPFFPKGTGALVDGTCVWNFFGQEVASDNVAALSASPFGTIQFSFGVTDVPAAGADLLMFDETLLVSKLKYEWLAAKGFASDLAQVDYRRSLEQSLSNDSPAPMLSLNASSTVADPLMGGQNFPITGFGG